MKGTLEPIVLIPRFTSYAGAGDYTTVAMELREYVTATVTLWRGPLLGTSPTFKFWFEYSRDGVTWAKEPVGGYDPGASAAMQISTGFPNRLFRIRVELGGTDPAVTCWCAGSIERRVES